MSRPDLAARNRLGRKRPFAQVCPVCGQTFEPRKIEQKVCSRKCRSLVASQAAAAALRDTGEGKAYPKLNGRHAHRVVAEQMLGRPLRPGEVVHHIDEDITNYHPDNLMVFPSQAAHVAHHQRGEANAT